MDNINCEITFDEKGVCNYCTNYYEIIKSIPSSQIEKDKILEEIIQKIKNEGKNKKYDCILGVSGGVDSTYIAYILKKKGVRILAVHFDNGWNSELAVYNIERTLKFLEIDLYTYVMDWEEFKDLQKSFLKASVSDGEIPTDHAFISVLYQVASKYRIKNVILGTNIVTEGILPMSWTYGTWDYRYIKNVHKIFGSTKLKSYPHRSLVKILYHNNFIGIKQDRLLDYMSYNKNDAVELLQTEIGYKPYHGKHYESVYTRFFQGYILPNKFKIDKRKAHLSALICSYQITRDDAIKLMTKDIYPSIELLNDDMTFVLKKLEMSISEFENIMCSRISTFKDYPSNYWFVFYKTKLADFLRKHGIKRKRGFIKI